MLFFKIKLTFVQMYNLGIHLGHTLKLSKFLSYWVYGGWRSNLFIINLVKTRVILKAMISTIEGAVMACKPIWFINIDKKTGGFINRYAIISGEPFCSHSWISGSLTNYRFIFNWYSMLYDFAKSERYKFRHKDKIKMLGYFGFLNHRSRFPAMGFVTSTISSWKAISEFWVISIPCAAVVDSNTLSWNVSLPIAGNDESLICLNYYCFLVSRNIIYAKMWNVLRFRKVIKYKFNESHLTPDINLKKKMLLIYLYHSNKKKTKVYDNMRKFFIKQDEKHEDIYNILKWEMDDLHLQYEMSVFNTGYAIFRNEAFFKHFGILYMDKWDSEEDLVFYNDPYRLY